MAFELDKLVRPNIKTLKPYSSAKDEYTGDANILLDANENSLGSPLTKWYNRYPDPYQKKLNETKIHVAYFNATINIRKPTKAHRCKASTLN